jgi:hypothetical protein
MDEFKQTSLFVRTAPYAVLYGTHYNGIYHYYGRADTFFHIGRAFGQGMLLLVTPIAPLAVEPGALLFALWKKVVDYVRRLF